MNLKKMLFAFALSTGFMVNAQISEETSQKLKPEETVPTEEPVYRNVEVMARYRGGYEVLLKEVEAATKNCKKGQLRGKNKNAEITAEVLVDKRGKVIDVHIVKGDTDLCKNEIINSLKAAKQWVPARIGTRTVNSYLRIRISLQNSYQNERKVARTTIS